MGEMIGMLGSSGFIGMGLGPFVGDGLLANASVDSLALRLFGWSALAGLGSLLFAFGATYRNDVNGDLIAATPKSIGLWKLVKQYHPGWTLLVACAMGIGIGTPTTFLSSLAEAKGIENLAWFWTPYAAIAFVVRIATRTLSDRWGSRPTIILGLVCMAASMFAYLAVKQPASLLLPAVLGGVAHAFLFPAVMAEGNHAFPTQFRGTATALMLMMFDVGLLVGQPVFGWTVEVTRDLGGDGYSVAFASLGTLFLLVTFIYRGKPKRIS